MMRYLQAALRGMQAEARAGDGGWRIVSGATEGLSGHGQRSEAGPVVSPETIMGLSTVWACTAATAQVIASLPCALYERGANGGKTRIDHELTGILFNRPNAMQTGVEHWEGQALKMILQGNAYARRMTIGRRLVGLEPLADVTPKRKGGGFEYEVTEDGRSYTLPADEVLHLRGFGAGNGLGLSAVRYGTQSMGAALAADQSAGAVFSNAMQPSGVLQTDQSLNADQKSQLREYLSQFVGSRKAGKAMVLEAGLSWQQIQWNPEDVQLLETRRFNVEDICRWFMIPPVIIGHAGQGQTMWGTGVEAIMLSWLKTGINPRLRRHEARQTADLVPPERRGKWFFEYNREAMLEMDSAAKSEFLSKMATSGTMTANERRAKLNLPPSNEPNADKLLAQTALAPLETLNKEARDAQ